MHMIAFWGQLPRLISTANWNINNVSVLVLLRINIDVSNPHKIGENIKTQKLNKNDCRALYNPIKYNKLN